jgi:Co/Zn/Cd efflux system component
MIRFFERKVTKAKGLMQEDFAVGPMQLSEGDGGSSFLACDDHDEVEVPKLPNDDVVEPPMQRVAEDEYEELVVRPSNVYVLVSSSNLFLEGSRSDSVPNFQFLSLNTQNVAFFSFLGFMAVQAVFALIAHSQSMLADSEAMSVDALTYLFNMCAERIKNRPFSEHELSLPSPVRLRRRTMKRLYLELIPPLISVTTLIIVTVFVLRDSLQTLFGEHGEYDQADDDVDVSIMLLFSGINLLLDIVNVTCFARAHQAFGLQTMGLQPAQHKSLRAHDFVKMTSVGAEVEFQQTVATEVTPLVVDETAEIVEKENPFGANLNMCSAWTVSNATPEIMVRYPCTQLTIHPLRSMYAPTPCAVSPFWLQHALRQDSLVSMVSSPMQRLPLWCPLSSFRVFVHYCTGFS